MYVENICDDESKYSLSKGNNLFIASSALPVGRADFQRMLARHAIPFATPHFCRKLVNYEYSDENE